MKAFTDDQLAELIGTPKVIDRYAADSAPFVVRETSLFTCGCVASRTSTSDPEHRWTVCPCATHAPEIYPHWFASART